MSLLGQSLSASEESVIAQMETVGLAVFDTEQPEDVELAYNKFGVFTPYYSVAFGGPIRSLRDRSFCGAANDPVFVTIAVGSYGPNTSSVRAAHADILDAITGFYPTDSGEIVLEGGSNLSFASNNVRPTIYGRITFGTYLTNIKGEE